MALRGSNDWVLETGQTGQWAEPSFWTSAEYQQGSPWPAVDVAAAFDALTRIYTPARTRRIFRGTLDTSRPLGHQYRGDGYLRLLLADPWAAFVSPLLAFGLDAVATRAWEHGSWIDALVADGRGCLGAMFEIEIAAALTRAGIPYVHEPLRGVSTSEGEKPKAPDFEIGRDRKVLLEVKLPRSGQRVRQEEEWLNLLSVGEMRPKNIPARLDLLDRFRELQEVDDGSWMRTHIRGLVRLVEDAKDRLAAGGTFPVSETVETCIRVTVTGPPAQSGGVQVLGLPTNSEREAARIVRNALTDDGASQIPPDRTGLVLIDPGRVVDCHVVAAEAERWFDTDGAGFPNVVGVLLVSHDYHPDFDLAARRIVTAWKPTAPEYLRTSKAWDRLSLGLSWHSLHRSAFRNHGHAWGVANDQPGDRPVPKPCSTCKGQCALDVRLQSAGTRNALTLSGGERRSASGGRNPGRAA